MSQVYGVQWKWQEIQYIKSIKKKFPTTTVIKCLKVIETHYTIVKKNDFNLWKGTLWHSEDHCILNQRQIMFSLRIFNFFSNQSGVILLVNSNAAYNVKNGYLLCMYKQNQMQNLVCVFFFFSKR